MMSSHLVSLLYHNLNSSSPAHHFTVETATLVPKIFQIYIQSKAENVSHELVYSNWKTL